MNGYWEKGVTEERTDGQPDNPEIIGPYCKAGVQKEQVFKKILKKLI